jgi:hypothetical protein
MNLLKFLKKEKAYSFEMLLQKAADKPAYRMEFLKRILTENLLILTNENTLAEGLYKLQKDTIVHVLTLSDGRVPIFTSKERIFDKGIFKKDSNFLEAKGKDIFEFLKGATLILNPYSDYSKEFLPDEVERLLKGTFFESKQIVVKKNTEVAIGQPAKYPTEVVKALTKIFSNKANVIAAYVGWIYDPKSGDPPHYIFGINADSDFKGTVNEVGYLVEQILGTNEIVDFIQIDDNNSFLSNYFTKSTTPFYEKPQ